MRRVALLLLMACLQKHGVLAADTRGFSVKAKLLPLEVEAADVPTYHAIIIGISKYKEWPSLLRPTQDCRELVDVLVSDYGFEARHVRELYDEQATRRNILTALYAAGDMMTSNDALLIFYAGHGYLDEKKGNGFWIPHDAPAPRGGMQLLGVSLSRTQQHSFSDYITNEDVINRVRDITKARDVLMISDSCFGGSLMQSRGLPGKGDERLPMTAIDNLSKKMLQLPSRTVMTSGALETVKDDSIFASKFLGALRHPAREVMSAYEIFNRAYSSIRAVGETLPQFGTVPGDRNHETGGIGEEEPFHTKMRPLNHVNQFVEVQGFVAERRLLDEVGVFESDSRVVAMFELGEFRQANGGQRRNGHAIDRNNIGDGEKTVGIEGGKSGESQTGDRLRGVLVGGQRVVDPARDQRHLRQQGIQIHDVRFTCV